MIKLKHLPAGLASSILIGVLAAPLAAQAQFSPVQNANQSATIRGNNNTINQEINQTIIFQPRVFGSRRSRGDSLLSPRYRQKKYKKGKRRYKQWKKGYDNKYKNWKRGWHRDDDDDDDYDDDDD